MIIAHVYDNERMATDAFRRDAYQVIDKIVLFSKCPKRFIIDGDDHWYMGVNQYCKWCKGREYLDNNTGKMMRSGYEVKSND